MATLEQKRRPLARSGWQNELWLIPVQVGILVALLVLWQVSVSQKNLMFFSRPTLVAQRLYELFVGGEIYRHILVTMQEVLIGYALGAFLGLTLGFILGRSKILSKIFQPFIIGLYSIPKIALAPLFIVWFGLGIESKVAVVLLATFFLVFFNTYSRAIERQRRVGPTRAPYEGVMGADSRAGDPASVSRPDLHWT